MSPSKIPLAPIMGANEVEVSPFGKVRKILVIQQKMIGDVLTSSILFEALRAHYPHAELHYLVQAHTVGVVEGNPFIDRIIIDGHDDNGRDLNFMSFLGYIKRLRYDVVIDAYSKIGSALLSFYSGAPIRISREKWYTSFLYTKTFKYAAKARTYAGLAIENRMRLLADLGNFPRAVRPKLYLTDHELNGAADLLVKHGLDPKQRLIMISMLGSSKKKTYPLPYLAELIDVIAELGNAQLLLNYLPDQKNQVNQLLNLCSNRSRKIISDQVYADTLRGFMALAAHCDAVIGNEGGAINMAKALDVPTFAIFSPQITRADWDIFSSDQNMAVHLSDFEPDLFIEKDKNKLWDEAPKLYQLFKPYLIKEKLWSFLEMNNKESTRAPGACETLAMSATMEKVTAIIPVYNEAHNIEAALQSVSFADEIMVVDSYSTDDTVAKARAFGPLIYQREFNYPASQKNWAIPQATHEWILLLDADERVTPALKAEIQNVLKDPPDEIDGYWIYRRNHFMGKPVKYSGWQNDKVVRLFRRDRCRYEDKMVHEEITTTGKLGFLKERLYHNTYVGIDHYLMKLNRYARWQAIDYDKKTKKLTPFHFFVKPLWRFFKHYVIQQGFRDGLVGFTISYLQSYALIMRYIKLWLYRRGQH